LQIPRRLTNPISTEKLLKDLNFEKRNDNGRRQITFKSFRDFVYSEIDQLGDTQLAEWHIGHKKSTYWSRSLEDKIKAFRNVESALTYLSADSIAASTQDLQSQNKVLRGELIGLKQQFAKLQETVMKNWLKDTKHQIDKLPDDEIQDKIVRVKGSPKIKNIATSS
jgi:hypothetical protein